MAMQLFIVYRYDRHVDPEITVHSTLAGANEAIEEFKGRYTDYFWKEETYGRDAGWIRYVSSDGDDGPDAHIEETELQD